MFRLVCFVEDKDLPKVLHAVAGLVTNMEPPQPVADQPAKAPKARAATLDGDVGDISLKQGLINALAAFDAPTITLKEMKNWWIEKGGKPTSMNFNLVQSFVKKGLITRLERGVYTINK